MYEWKFGSQKRRGEAKKLKLIALMVSQVAANKFCQPSAYGTLSDISHELCEIDSKRGRRSAFERKTNLITFEKCVYFGKMFKTPCYTCIAIFKLALVIYNSTSIFTLCNMMCPLVRVLML